MKLQIAYFSSRPLRLGWLASIFCAVVGCTRPPADPKAQVLARVNGESVFLSEFLMNFHQLKAAERDAAAPPPKAIEAMKSRALNEVIVMGMLRQEAAKKQIHIAKEEVEGRLANWKDSYAPGGFEEMLRKQSTTEEFLKRRIEDQLLIEKIAGTLFTSETLVSDEEMNKYYKAHEKEFFRAERVHVFQIVVPSDHEADKIRQEILSNATTFESAARKYSLSPDSAKGGDLGFFSKNEKIAAFNEALHLPVNAISKNIHSPYGVHLLKVVEKQPSQKLSFNDAKNDIVKALKRLKEVKVYKEWVTKLLKDGEIYRNEALFAITN